MIRIGTRIRFLESPETTAHWQRCNPGQWFPRYGEIGTIVALSSGGLGSGPLVQWDNGRSSWLGSLSEYEVIE